MTGNKMGSGSSTFSGNPDNLTSEEILSFFYGKACKITDENYMKILRLALKSHRFSIETKKSMVSIFVRDKGNLNRNIGDVSLLVFCLDTNINVDVEIIRHIIDLGYNLNTKNFRGKYPIFGITEVKPNLIEHVYNNTRDDIRQEWENHYIKKIQSPGVGGITVLPKPYWLDSVLNILGDKLSHISLSEYIAKCIAEHFYRNFKMSVSVLSQSLEVRSDTIEGIQNYCKLVNIDYNKYLSEINGWTHPKNLTIVFRDLKKNYPLDSFSLSTTYGGDYSDFDFDSDYDYNFDYDYDYYYDSDYYYHRRRYKPRNVFKIKMRRYYHEFSYKNTTFSIDYANYLKGALANQLTINNNNLSDVFERLRLGMLIYDPEVKYEHKPTERFNSTVSKFSAMFSNIGTEELRSELSDFWEPYIGSDYSLDYWKTHIKSLTEKITKDTIDEYTRKDDDSVVNIILD